MDQSTVLKLVPRGPGGVDGDGDGRLEGEGQGGGAQAGGQALSLLLARRGPEGHGGLLGRGGGRRGRRGRLGSAGETHGYGFFPLEGLDFVTPRYPFAYAARACFSA